jgi:methionine--tRNA ligase beta chain
MTEFRVAPGKPVIPFAVFDKVDVRVGTIERVEDVERSDKLVRLTVNIGDRTLSVLVGMKGERKDPREIEGKQAVFVVNLEPRRMVGEVSEALLLDIGYADGLAPALAVPERPVPNGARLG